MRSSAALRKAILLALLVGVWEAYVATSHVDHLLFASPWQTVHAFAAGWADGSLAGPTWTTLRILLESFGIGLGVALGFTVMATLSTIGTDLLDLLTSVFNPLPGVVVLPLAMLWFGIDTSAIVFTVAFATIWPIAINMSMGFKTVSPTVVAVGRTIGLKPLRIVTDVLIPAALPHAVTGLKTAWAFGWRTMIASELVFGVAGSKGGLGNYINNARLYFLTPRIFAGLVTIALLGVVFESLFGLAERGTVVRWGMKHS
ncbi:MAG TPA: ABC transporter permease [Gaiellaceae bacterium]|nr:ABC transporter permease [Gaiellaceae bacterium]